MSVDAEGVLAILLMGLATYATRIGGFVLIRRFRPGPFLEAWFGHVPGAVFAALVAPSVWQAGPPGWIGAGVGFLAMRWSGQFLIALFLSVASFALVRHLMT
ncbi:AzlD family protein [Geminicoccus roseus]|uniref:AzlD family protein n=1 Tax=Geminicoccus roseus TaxID=404900 RepID=UPI000408868D|nr:AzlD domain-containing protein [Geminicoccus roseus]